MRFPSLTGTTAKDWPELPYEVRFLAIDTVTPGVRASIAINGGQVLRANSSADNGIVHIIDKVLIPPFVMP